MQHKVRVNHTNTFIHTMIKYMNNRLAIVDK